MVDKNIMLSDEDREYILQKCKHNHILAIKLVRAITGCDLWEAKRIVCEIFPDEDLPPFYNEETAQTTKQLKKASLAKKEKAQAKIRPQKQSKSKITFGGIIISIFKAIFATLVWAIYFAILIAVLYFLARVLSTTGIIGLDKDSIYNLAVTAYFGILIIEFLCSFIASLMGKDAIGFALSTLDNTITYIVVRSLVDSEYERKAKIESKYNRKK